MDMYKAVITLEDGAIITGHPKTVKDFIQWLSVFLDDFRDFCIISIILTKEEK